MNNITVSIITLTYNHEAFIEQAIKGVLAQRTSFDWELIVADDCSTDNTKFICESVSNDARIIYIRNGQNLGANRNFFNAYKIARGKYVAFCEGDDYWTDSAKLQKQVDFLEANPDYAICFHDVLELNDGIPRANSIVYSKDIYDIVDLASENFMHTPSVVAKRLSLNEIPFYFENLYVGDYPMHMYAAKKGRIKFLPEKMAVFRIHSSGSWSSKAETFIYEKIAEYLEFLRRDRFAPDVRRILTRRLIGAYQNLLSRTKDNTYLYKIAEIDPLLSAKLVLKNFFD